MKSSSSSEDETKSEFKSTLYERITISRNLLSPKVSLKIISEEDETSFKIKPLKKPQFYSSLPESSSNNYRYFKFRKRQRLSTDGIPTIGPVHTLGRSNSWSSSSDSNEGESDYAPIDILSRKRRFTRYTASPNKGVNKETPLQAEVAKKGFASYINNLPRLETSNWKLVKETEPRDCPISMLPDEILLRIFHYFALHSLVHILSNVCKRWETLALDRTLWKKVETFSIENMIMSTAKLRTLLKAMANLKSLTISLRNDTEDVLADVFEKNQRLEVLTLDRCYQSSMQLHIMAQTVTSIVRYCPNLTSVTISDTFFHSKAFYKTLAERFPTLQRINITCTTKSEMNVFVKNLATTIPNVDFQEVPMMGKAGGKQIYWGPILGLLVRPIPMSPFYSSTQRNEDPYPNYFF